MGIFTDIYNELVVIQEENQKQKKSNILIPNVGI